MKRIWEKKRPHIKNVLRRMLAFICVISMISSNFLWTIKGVAYEYEVTSTGDGPVIAVEKQNYEIKQNEALDFVFHVSVIETPIVSGAAIQLAGAFEAASGAAIEPDDQARNQATLSRVEVISLDNDYFVESGITVTELVDGNYHLSAIPVQDAMGTGFLEIMAEDDSGNVSNLIITVVIKEDVPLPVIVLDSKEVEIVQNEVIIKEFLVNQINSSGITVSGSAITVTALSQDTSLFEDTGLVVEEIVEGKYRLTATPVLDVMGIGKIRIVAENSAGDSVWEELDVTIIEDIKDPVIGEIPKLILDVGTDLSIDLDSYSSDPNGLELVYSIETMPVEGTVSLNGNKLTYHAELNANKADQFVLRVSNGKKYTDKIIEVEIYATPAVPAVAPNITIDEDTVGNTNLVDLCTDIHGRELVYTILTAPMNGSASITGGLLSYTPSADYFGTDQLEIMVSNGRNSNTFQIDYQINPVEDAPKAVADYASVDSTGSVTIDVLANDLVVDTGSQLELLTNFSVLPQKAAVCEVQNGKIYYKPDPRASGTDTFVYQVRHSGGSLVAEGTVTIDITSKNAPPQIVVESLPFEINEDDTFSFTFKLIDVDSTDIENGYDIDILSSNDSVFANGNYTLSLQSKVSQDEVIYKVEWQPEPYSNTTEYGNVTFTINIEDKLDQSSSASTNFPVVVHSVNNPPEIKDLNPVYTMLEDGTLAIDFTVYDPDTMNPLDEFEITCLSTDLTVLLSSGITISQPVLVDSRTAKYTMTIKPRKDQNSDTGFLLKITAKDQKGSSNQEMDQKEITLIVTPVNDPPIAKNDSYNINEDVVTVFDVLANDIDVDGKETIKIISVSDNMEGSTVTIAPDGKTVTYTPKLDYYGTDRFRYTIEDDHGEQSSAWVNITINAVNDKPIFIDINSTLDPYTTLEDTYLEIPIKVSDVETEALALMLQANVESGNSLIDYVFIKEVDPLQPNKRVICLQPSEDQNGIAVIKLLLSDGEEEVIHYITVKIEAVNDPPVAVDDLRTYTEDTPLYISVSKLLENDYDVDAETNGDTFTLVSFTQPSYGTVELGLDPNTIDPNTGIGVPAFCYKPNHNSERSDSFTYTIEDSGGLQATATVKLQCIPVNDPPELDMIPDQVMQEDGTLVVALNFSDPETDNADLIVTASASNPQIINSKGLVIDVVAGKLTIIPLPDQFTEDTPVTITIVVSDGLLSVSRTFLVTINPVPDAPVARDVKYTTKDNSPITFDPTENDYDVDPGDSITLTDIVMRAPINGTLVNNSDGTFTYVSDSGYEGIQYIDYTIEDTTGLTDTAVIEIEVVSQGIGPMILPIASIITYADQPIPTIPLEIFNVPVDQPFSLDITSSNQNLISDAKIKISGGSNVETALVGLNQSLDLELEPGMIGETTITAILNYNGKSDKIEFIITVTRNNDAPTINDDVYTFDEGQTVVLDVLANDTDVQMPLDLRVLYISQKPSYGKVSITADGKIEYKPNTWNGLYYYNGVDTFKYVAADGGGLTGEALVTLNINPYPTRPFAIRDTILVENDAIGTIERLDTMLDNDRDYDEIQSELDSMQIAEIEFLDGGEQPVYTISSDGKGMELTVPSPGWYSYRYKCKTLRDGTTDVWDVSNFTELWIGVKDEHGNIPPRIDNHSFQINEDHGEYIYKVNHLIHATDTDTYPLTAELVSDTVVRTLTDVIPLHKVSVLAADPIIENIQFYRTGSDVFLKFNTVLNQNGSTKIYWKITQNGTESKASYITIGVIPVNDAPVVEPIADIETYRSDLTEVEITVSDVDNTHDQLMISVNSDNNSLIPSENITVEKKAGDNDNYIIRFTPPRNEVLYMNFPITLKVTASDGELTDTKSFIVIVKPKNNPPEAKPVAIERIDEDTVGEFNVIDWGKDLDGDVMSIICDNSQDSETGIFLNGVHDSAMGVLRTDTKKIIFVPKKDYYSVNGDEIEIRYKLADLESKSNLGVIQLTIDPVNDLPSIYGIHEEYTMIEDAVGYYIEYKVKDVDLDDLTFGAEHDDPSRIKELRVEETKHGPGDYTVKLFITPVPDACHYTGDALTNITVWAKDGEGKGSETIKLTIHPVNDAVKLIDGYTLPLEMEMDEDTVLTIDLCSYFIDPDGDPIKITSITNVTHGAATNKNNKVEFTPVKDYFTKDTQVDDDYAWLDYTVSDPYNGETSGKIKINIKPVNDAPVAPNFKVETLEDVPLSINPMPGMGTDKLVWDVDDELDTLIISQVTKPANGKVEIVAGGKELLYTPDLDWFGTETFDYTIRDPGGLETTGQITVKVVSVADDPRIAFYQDGNPLWDTVQSEPDDIVWWEMDEDIAESFQIRMWIPEPNTNLVLKIIAKNISDENAHTTIIPREKVNFTGNGEYRTVNLVPLLNQFGELRLEFQLSDGAHTVYRDVYVRVRSVNDLPVMANQTATVEEDGSITKTIAATDVETPSSLLRYYLHGDLTGNPVQPLHGTAVVDTVSGQGEWTYTPDPDYYGSDSFQIDVIDEDGGVTTATITITVTPINDAPTAPTDLATNSEWYRDGDTIQVSFTPGTDKWNETPQALLTYDIETSLDGGVTWAVSANKYLGTIGMDGKIIYSFSPPAGANTDLFTIKMRTVDDDAVNPLKSNWIVSGTKKIDNRKPESTHSLTPNIWCNTDVVIEILSEDKGLGATGLKVVSGPSIGVTTLLEDYNGGIFQYSVKENGTYVFGVEDYAGNIETHTVVVSNIDKLDPDVRATPMTDNGTAISPITVTLNYSDATADSSYGESGLKDKKFIVTENATMPSANDIGWVDYTNPLNINIKGVWHVYGKVSDVAGNIVIKRFGTYTIHNSVPVAEDVTVTVYEHTIDDTRKNSVDILLDVNDDDNDVLEYEITTPLTPNYGTWELVSKGHYRFTHNGDGSPPFVQTLTATYKATDIDGAESNEATITVNVVEVNDAPTPPSITGPAAGSEFRGMDLGVTNGTVNLQWTKGEDEETADNLLKYEIEVTYNGTDFSPVTTTGAGQLLYNFNCPTDKTTNQFYFRIRTVDDDMTDGKESVWAESPKYLLDNAVPTVSHTLEPAVWCNTAVKIHLNVSDPQPGDTGVVSVQSLSAGTTELKKDLVNGELIYQVDKNGDYLFEVTDQVGNINNYTVTVSNIDILKPEVTIHTNTVTGSAILPVYVDLTYTDQAQTADYGQSMVKDKKYIISGSDNMPASNNPGWLNYTGQLEINVKGTWFVFAKVTDHAGNEVIRRLGQYAISNTPPVAQDFNITVYEHSIDATKQNKAAFQLKTSDIDNDVLKHTILQVPDLKYGDLQCISEAMNQYEFTHTGLGKPTVVSPLYITYQAQDIEGALSNVATITITVVEVNDPPEKPAITGPVGGGIYRGKAALVTNGTVDLVWTTGTDEETSDNDLRYEIEVTFDGINWSSVTTTAAGALSYHYDCPTDKDTDKFQFRIRTVDDYPADQKSSDWEHSPIYILDNTSPTVSHVTNPALPNYSNSEVDITLTAIDQGDGATGVKSVTRITTGLTIINENYSLGVFKYKVNANGSYQFQVEDNAGNITIHTVIVNNIDKLPPGTAASPASGNGSTTSKITVTLTYTDALPTATDVQSGVNDKKYILTTDSATPVSSDGRWIDYTAPVVIGEKGIWYLYTKVTDHAGNEDIQQYGTYNIANSLPIAADQTVTVYEHTLDQSRTNQVIFDFSATDADQDPLTYHLQTEPDVKYGTLAAVGGSTQRYSFTHSGFGKPTVQTPLHVTYVAKDNEGAVSNVGTITIQVVEVNDTPNAPVVTEPAAGSIYRGNNIGVTNGVVPLEWLAGNDEETADNDLLYEIEVTFDGNNWSAVTTTVAGAVDYNYNCPTDKNTAKFQFRIRTVDDYPADQKNSDWAYSPLYILDNTSPTVSHVTNPALPNYSNNEVEIVLTATDLGDGATGVQSVTRISTGLTIINENYSLGVFRYKVNANGSYQFQVEDKAGNVTTHTVTVNNIDKLPPGTTASPTSGNGSATSKITVSLTYTDALPTAADVQSGVKDKKYILTTETATPASSDNRWSDYTAPVVIGEKGIWYLYTKVTDHAGNEVIQQYGDYNIANSLPIAADQTVIVYEHTLDQSRINQVLVDFSATDADQDPLTYHLVSVPDAKFGTLKAVAGSTQKYIFTHSGFGKPTVQTPLYVTYVAKDNEGAVSNVGTITIQVVEVNDTPDAPAVTGPSAGNIYRGDKAGVTNGVVNLKWIAGDDEETSIHNLSYEIEVTYDGTSWSPIVVATGGAIEYNFSCPVDKSTNQMQFRVRTVDDHPTDQKVSTWSYSSTYILDNIAPEINFTAVNNGVVYQPGENAIYSIDVALSYGDDGFSGLKLRKYCITESTLRPSQATFITLNKNQHSIRFEEIGEKYIHVYATDLAGNETYRCIGPFKIVNTPPIAVSRELEVEEGASIPIVLEGIDNDPNDGIASHTITALPVHGILTPELTDGHYTYTHDGLEDGLPDQIKFKVTDLNGVESSEGIITIIVIPVNDPPQINNLSPTELMLENTQKIIEFDIFDPDDLIRDLKLDVVSSQEDIVDRDSFTLSINSSGKVSLKIKPKRDKYTTAGNPIFIDITVTDPHGESVTERMELEVLMVNQPPRTKDQFYLIVPGASMSNRVKAIDRENDPLTYTLKQAPIHGTFTMDPDFLTNGEFRYEADTNFPDNGNDYVDIEISDGVNTVNCRITFSGKISITEDQGLVDNIITIPDLADIEEVSTEVKCDNQDLITLDSIQFEIDENGEVDLTFEALPDQFGIANITLIIYTNDVKKTEYTFSIHVQAENDEPRTENLLLTTSPLMRSSRLAGKVEADDSIDQQFATSGFIFSCDNLLDQPSNGTLQLNGDGTFFYTPKVGFVGTDEFYVTIQEMDNDLMNNPAPPALPDGVDIDTDDRLSVKAKVTVEVAIPVEEPEDPNNGGSSGKPGDPNEPGGSNGSGSSGESSGGNNNPGDNSGNQNPDGEEEKENNDSDQSEETDTSTGNGEGSNSSANPWEEFDKDGDKYPGEFIWFPTYFEDSLVPKGSFENNNMTISIMERLYERNQISNNKNENPTKNGTVILAELSVNQSTIDPDNTGSKEYSNSSAIQNTELIEEGTKQADNKPTQTQDIDVTVENNEMEIDQPAAESETTKRTMPIAGGVTLSLFLFFILFQSRIVILVDDPEKKKKRRKYIYCFRRVHHRDVMTLKIKNRKEVEFIEGATTIRFGIFYRRKFYEQDLNFIIDGQERSTVVPKKKIYKDQNGVIM